MNRNTAFTVGDRVRPTCALPGQPPMAVWVVSDLCDDGLHAYISREHQPDGPHTARFRLPLVNLTPLPPK